MIAMTCLLFAALTTGASAPFDPPSIELAPEFARVLTDYEQAWTAGDEDALASLFTEDGWVLSSGRPPVHGRDAITARYQDSQGPLALRAVFLEVENDLAIMIGGYAMERGSPDVGKFTLTLRRGEDGRWLIISDMDNSNRRAR